VSDAEPTFGSSSPRPSMPSLSVARTTPPPRADPPAGRGRAEPARAGDAAGRRAPPPRAGPLARGTRPGRPWRGRGGAGTSAWEGPLVGRTLLAPGLPSDW